MISLLLRYGGTVVAVGLAALARWGVGRYLHDTAPFPTFYLAMMVAAIMGGAGPALLATALGAVAAIWPWGDGPARATGAITASDVRLVLFVTTGLIGSLLAARAHARHRQSVRQAKEAERAADTIRQSRERYRLASQATHDVIWEWDLASDELAWNATIEATLGYRLEEVPATAAWWAEHIHPDDRDRVLKSLGTLIDNRGAGDRWTGEYRFRHRQGHWISVLDRALLARDEAGRAVRMVGAMMDLTEQKRAEEALRQVADQFRELAEAMPQLVWIVGADGCHEYYNQRWCDFTGRRLEQSRGERWLELVHPDDRRRTLEYWRRSLRSGEPYQIEYRLRRASDGTYRWILARAVPVRDERGNPVRWFGTGTDIQDQKQLQEELAAARVAAERAKAEAEEASKAKDQFLAVLGHELRNPLTPVLATASLMERDDRLPEEYREDVEVIRRNAELEARLIDDLLDLTRIARGKITLDRKPVALGEVIDRAVEVCRPDVRAKRLHLGLDMGPADRPYVVNADAARLQQVFWNLLKNAVKFTPPGGSINICCRAQGGGGDVVLAEVSDTGEGIDPALLPHIFDAFEQGGQHVTRQFGGLGLGLAITKSLVEKHGGTIEARSQGKGRGASFRVRLPLIATRVVAALPRREGAATAAEPHQHRPAALHILFVEDDRDTARIVRRLLTAQGHRVEVAGSVAAALERANAGRFDLLISDLGLPDGSGMDLIRSLRRQGWIMPGIALSGYGQEQDVRRSREAGFTAHLTKPVGLDQLLATIGTVTDAAADTSAAKG